MTTAVLALDVVTSETISEAFHHPIDVTHDDGRRSARARRRLVV